MHKKRQANSRTNRKGKKLHGLTAQEGQQRAKKAWQTKHSKYRYGKRKFAISNEDDHNFLQKLAKSDPHEYEYEMARRMASGHEFDEVGFKNYIKNRTKGEKSEFAAKVAKAKDYEQALAAHRQEQASKQFPDSENRGKIKEMLGKVEPGEYGQAPHEIKLLSKLSPLINPETSIGRDPKRENASASRLGLNEIVKKLTIVNGRQYANGEDVKKLSDDIIDSHFASSTVARSAAHIRAKRRLSRMAVDIQHQANKDDALDYLVKISPKIEGEAKAKASKELVPIEKRLAPTADATTEKFSGMIDRIKFSGRQTKEKASAISQGHFTRFYDKKGQTTPDKAKFSITPNKVWKYKLALPPGSKLVPTPHKPQKMEDIPSADASFHKKLEYWDVSKAERNTGGSRFHRGHRGKDGKLLGDEYDEVMQESLVGKYGHAVNFEVGKRGMPDRTAPKHLDKEVFIEHPDVKPGQMIKAGKTFAGTSTNTVHQIRDPSGRWVDASAREYESTPARLNMDDPKRPYGAPQRRKMVSPKPVQVYYVSPGSTKLLKGQGDTINLKLPSAPYLGLGEHMLGAKLDDTRAGELLSAPARSKQKRETAELGVKLGADEHFRKEYKDQLMREDVKMRERNAADSHINELIAAGITATAYASRNRIKRGYIPQRVNKVVGKVWPGVTAMDVNDAYVRPVAEHKANVKYTLRHPTSSPSGEWGGLHISSIRDRKHFIEPDTRYARMLDSRRHEIGRIDRTLESAQKAHTKTGIRGAVDRVLTERAVRNREYGHFADGTNSVLGRARHDASNVLDPSTYGAGIRNRAGDYEMVEGLKFAPTMKDQIEQGLKFPKTKAAAENLMTESLQTQHKYDNLHTATVLGSKGAIFPKASRWSHGSFTGNEKGILIGGAVIGTAIGAGYLYHRHNEKKKAEDEKVAFYNKIIPSPIKSPIATPGMPKITKAYKIKSSTLADELMLTGTRLPSRVFVPTSKRQLWKGSPADRGYGKNAAIGKPSLGLKSTGEAKLREGFIVNMDRAEQGPRKTSKVSRDRQNLVLLGKKTPVYGEFGKRQRVMLSPTNPNRMSQEDMDKVVWAHAGTHGPLGASGGYHESEVKNFYAMAGKDKVVETMNDPKEVRNIQKRYATAEMQDFQRRVENAHEPTKGLIASAGNLDEGTKSAYTTGVYVAVPSGASKGKELDSFVHGIGNPPAGKQLSLNDDWVHKPDVAPSETRAVSRGKNKSRALRSLSNPKENVTDIDKRKRKARRKK